MGVVKRTGSEHELKAGRFLLGDRLAEVLAEGLSHKEARLTDIDLSENRLSKKGAV
jgi:hypothetical protein